MFDLQKIFNEFEVADEFVKASEIGSGHINDTYLIQTESKYDYVLQRINHLVFPDVPSLVKNKVLISRHLREKFNYLSDDEIQKRVLTFIQAKSGENYLHDKEGNYWNLTVNIHGCKTYERVTSSKVAFEAGKLFGEFLHLTSDFNASRLAEIIPNFHKMSFRFEQFDAALANASETRNEKAAELIDFANKRRAEVQILENLIGEGKISLRATHNDTKISNALFSPENKALCVIDTDTVMPGIVHFDFGDAVRTICNTGDEDEADLANVEFNIKYFEEFTKGFIQELGGELSEVEARYLAFSAKAMTFMVGLRMLTDFLQNDIYFRTSHEFQNLHRAKSQFKLVSEIENNLDEMEAIVSREYAKSAGKQGVKT